MWLEVVHQEWKQSMQAMMPLCAIRRIPGDLLADDHSDAVRTIVLSRLAKQLLVVKDQ